MSELYKAFQVDGGTDYAAIREAANDPNHPALTVSENDYDEMLGVLPPIYVPGGFLMSEPVTGDSRGDVYAMYARSGEKHLARFVIRDRPETYIKH